MCVGEGLQENTEMLLIQAECGGEELRERTNRVTKTRLIKRSEKVRMIFIRVF